MNIIAFIPARGGSKAIPRKNIFPFLGKPLISYTLDQAISADSFDQIFVSTDLHDIELIAKSFGVSVDYRQDQYLCGDSSSATEVAIEFAKRLDPEDVVVMLQPTSPLRTPKSIADAVRAFKQDRAKSLVSVVKVTQYLEWQFNINTDGVLARDHLSNSRALPQRQDIPTRYLLNGCIYIASASFLLEHQSFIADGFTRPFLMNENESIDINTYEEIAIAEYYHNLSCSE